MKTKNMKKNFAEKAYQKTNVKASDSQDQITKKLNELGITDIRFTQSGSDHICEFLVKLQHQEYPRKVKINIPLNKDLDDSFKQKYQNDKNILFRVLFHNLKNRFVSIQNGLREFDEEFMSDICLIINGKEQRLGDIVIPQIKAQLKQSDKILLNITNQ